MPYREDLEAERARADALAEKTEELARENAELHAKLDATHAPTPPPAAVPLPAPEPTERKPSTVRRWFLELSLPRAWTIAAFISFMGAIAGTGCVSGTMKLAAPVVCPKGYDHSIVVLHIRGTSKGGTSYTGDLWCAFSEKHRFPENADTFAVLGVIFGEYLLVTMALASILALLRKRRDA